MIRKFSRYAIVGVINAFVHVVILVSFVEVLHQDPVLSSMVGFLIALAIAYYLNHYWTFQSSSSHSHVFPRYVIVSLVGLSLNVGIMHLAVNILDWFYLSGQVCAIVVVPTSNFLLNYYWAFSASSKTA